jgi:hypothetical protein
MKKIAIMMMVALVAISASAASIDWKFTGLTTASKRIVDSTGANYNGNIYLILSENVSSLTSTTDQASFETALNSITLGTTAVTDGKAANATATTSMLANTSTDYTFSVVVYDGTGYYISASKTQKAYTDPTTPTSVTFTAQDIGATYQNAQGVKFTAVAVPEPASAMLALAGVAMLIRRRK